MLGDSSSSVPGGDVATTTGHGRESTEVAAAGMVGVGLGGGGGSSNSGDEDRSGGGFGGNRWPRQETLALLKIRSDMDVAFRDASLKGPLWEEISRKLAELGYNRSAKKCKEKFENVYKYHRRTKDGRTSKSHGKTYRFFDQLEAFESSSPTPPPGPPPTTPKPQVTVVAAATVSTTMPTVDHSSLSHNNNISTVPSTSQNIVTSPPQQPPINLTNLPSFLPTNSNPTILQPQPRNPINNHQTNMASSFQNMSTDLQLSNSTSSSTSSDMELEGRRKRKRKWKEFFERLMKEVIEKQEELQKKFLEAIEKREHERMVREESWRIQEMTRINKEREILAQERSLAAAKDGAVMSFLQKISDQHQQNRGGQDQLQNNPQPVVSVPIPAAVAPPQPAPSLPRQPVPSYTGPQTLSQQVVNIDQSTFKTTTTDNGDQNSMMGSGGGSSSRWPKTEVQALISLRTHLDSKYQENGPKGPLWEEISSGMKKLGYNRSSKRCKEKWENINKYFKKVKESNKKRPEDAKTCPYFHQLDALYRQKHNIKSDGSPPPKPENSVPIMVRPEQQWPPPPPHPLPLQQSQPPQSSRQDSVMDDIFESDHMVDDEDDGEDDYDDDEEEDNGDDYELVANKQLNAAN